ncbi:amidohydrolase family protein [Halomicroarcula sp. GCM10025709]|uniref:amidohydrolase family protein n=1 Tax=Haloarcula TaxID=2237 RepID=UPI0024C3A3B9|nr:amidohydrolase family protein [Halomicroarcula sp. YJ-61-S]
MTVDFGGHLYPESVYPDPIREGQLGELLGPRLSDPDTLVDLYDAAGVDEVVLSQPFYMGSSDVEGVRSANDALLEVVTDYDRFYGLAAIPVAAGGEAAAREFERALDQGYHGGAVETKTEGVELTDSQLEPVFEVAERHDAPLLVHPKLHESVHPEALDDTYLLNAIFGREAALSESICKVIHEGVLDSYQDLNLVFHHLGGNIASMLGRVHLQLDAGRWPGQDSVVPYEEFKRYLDERIYLDTSGFFGYEQPLRATFDEIPTSQVVFGTDYPFEPRDGDEIDELAAAVDRCSPEGAAQQVLAENALSLLVDP